MSGFVFCSHDGYGVGHTRRNVVVARALRALVPGAPITLVTGLPFMPLWLAESGCRIVQFPQLLKDRSGRYTSTEHDADTALKIREQVFADVVADQRPDVVLVDRHPFGIAGELAAGLAVARRNGARVLLGLRDILDESTKVRAEIAGPRWQGAEAVFDHAIVYGAPHFCDHHAEYGVPLPLAYCGWAVEVAEPGPVRRRNLTVTSGGGADGYALFELGVGTAERLPNWSVTIAAGGYVEPSRLEELIAASTASARIERHWRAPGCVELFATTAATLQMAGYNSTFEALAAGRRPILVPRRFPRTEQAIRAERLSALGVADVVAPDAADDVGALLERSRLLSDGAATRAGLRFDGAANAAAILADSRRTAGVGPSTARLSCTG